MVWLCIVAPLSQRKARRRKSILTLSLLNQSTPPCTSATTSSTPRCEILLSNFHAHSIVFFFREVLWYVNLTFVSLLFLRYSTFSRSIHSTLQHRHWQPCSLMTANLASLWSTGVGHSSAHCRATPGRCCTSSLWTYPRSTVLNQNAQKRNILLTFPN